MENFKPCTLTLVGMHVAGMTTLTDLDLSYCPFTSAGLSKLEGLPLKRLELTGTYKIADAGFPALKNAPLEDIRLSHCNISDFGVYTLISGKPLTRLDLLGCRMVTDRILRAFSGLPLKELNVNHGQFSAAAIERLYQAFPSIKLDIEF